jgi:hypothetical protein
MDDSQRLLPTGFNEWRTISCLLKIIQASKSQTKTVEFNLCIQTYEPFWIYSNHHITETYLNIRPNNCVGCIKLSYLF